MATSMEERLEQRKLDALKRGIHRMGKEATVPFAVHVLGIGKAGADVIAETLAQLDGEGPTFHALAVDIGDQDMARVREAAARLPEGRARVETVALEVPSRDDLFGGMRRYREFLKLEYPRYYWNPNYEPWLPLATQMPAAGDHFKRALAKAVYGLSYYDEPRPLAGALKRFAEGVDSTGAQSVVAVAFGLGGGTGSGIVVDLARHLTNVMFGRRNLVLGLGILPCTGDAPEHRGAALFPTLNELDCMADQAKNEGVITVWGDLNRNPFNGGVMLVPQEHVFQATHDLAATHKRVDAEVASLLTRNNGNDLWETLRLLNWVGAPPTQHSAARTQYGPRWAHVLGFADLDGPIAAGPELRGQLGLLPGYRPDFYELRAPAGGGAKVTEVAAALHEVFKPVAEADVIEGGPAGSVQFVLPCVSKQDLAAFYDAREAYDTGTWDEKLLDHSWLLDLGVLLSEPAIRFEGMAGECLWGCACWVVVPYEDIRGPDRPGATAAPTAKAGKGRAKAGAGA